MPRSDFPALPEKPKVPLVGEDGNAMAIMARVSRALRRSGHDECRFRIGPPNRIADPEKQPGEHECD